MKQFILCCTLICFFGFAFSATDQNTNFKSTSIESTNTKSTTKLNLIPTPQYIEVSSTTPIEINNIQNWKIFAKSFPDTKTSFIKFLNDNKNEYKKEHSQPTSNQLNNHQSNMMIIAILKNNDLSSEQYKLTINQDILIEASTEQGAFYALQSFKQLYLANQLFNLEINDEPSNNWRGNMIDVARHFRSVDYLKRHIELMAYYKMNRLHLHLSDDQGFRIEIKAYPKLTDISGKTSVYNDPAGFYTQAKMKDLILFAKKHHIEIIPEIDIPAHTRAITHAYPDLACQGDDTNHYSGTRVLKTKLCLQKQPLVDHFLNTAFNEIATLFPSKYIHIGADEVQFKKGFEQQESKLLTQLFQKLITQLNQQGKTVIAWEEILNYDIKGDVIAQIWNNKPSVIKKAQKSQTPVILSLCKHAYFDHGYYLNQEKMTTWCNKNGVTLHDAFSMPKFETLKIIGHESALWGEFVRNDKRADLRLWPRLLATAQTSWNTQHALNFTQFKNQVDAQLPYLDSKGVQYFNDY